MKKISLVLVIMLFALTLSACELGPFIPEATVKTAVFIAKYWYAFPIFAVLFTVMYVWLEREEKKK